MIKPNEWTVNPDNEADHEKIYVEEVDEGGMI